MRKRLFMAMLLTGVLLFLAAFAAGAAPVTIQYAYWGDQNEETSTTALLQKFMDANPDITVTGLRFGSNTDFNDKITTLAAAGTLPDVSTFYEPNVLTWGMNGQFVDLTDFYKKANPKIDAIKFITPDGKIVGISVANEIMVLWYNKRIFDAAGLPYPPSDPKKAWTVLLEFAEGDRLLRRAQHDRRDALRPRRGAAPQPEDQGTGGLPQHLLPAHDRSHRSLQRAVAVAVQS